MTPEEDLIIETLKGKAPEDITFCELCDLNILLHRQEDEIKQAKKEAWIAWNDAQEQKDLL
jgi:hypothetical protein